MFAVTGITGNVGSVVARMLLAEREDVRAIVRSGAKSTEWEEQGCETFVADIRDQHALAKAYSGMRGAFVMLPMCTLEDDDGFNLNDVVDSIHYALREGKPERVVCLSTLQSLVDKSASSNAFSYLESKLGTLPMPLAFVRSAWYVENSAREVAEACETGVLRSFLYPLDRAVPMIATADVGRVIAQTLCETWSGKRTIEVVGPAQVSPNELAKVLGWVLGREINAEAVPRERWEQIFSAKTQSTNLYIQMLDALNAGSAHREVAGIDRRTGHIHPEVVLNDLVARALTWP
ncbi:NmrA family NAD(P)-binding protein [Paraburkholderia caribensis]|uniref:NmrA family NAD(P)-binding protein n=1 Tax=Paraburkholderia caribensis TaxID=75105 RepID=UPI001CB5466E|nr:NmrA family NAD(P)-binding protein [Paraburkholderia caribensis]CAG9243731.1 putative NAD(P)H dehydrogenase (quinone) [Paraburkholderia caribensis]